MVNFLVGNRTEESGRVFLTELASRLGDSKPLFTSDELKVYASLLLELYHETVEEEPTGETWQTSKFLHYSTGRC